MPPAYAGLTVCQAPSGRSDGAIERVQADPYCLTKDKAVPGCQRKTGKEPAPSQRGARRQALASRVLVLTGGPGVGKTTLVNAILLSGN
jgi:Mrp family chromosome partitioning ATPase